MKALAPADMARALLLLMTAVGDVSAEEGIAFGRRQGLQQRLTDTVMATAQVPQVPQALQARRAR